MNNPLGIALTLARPLRRLARLANPMVQLLSRAPDFVLRFFGIKPKSEPLVTEEEFQTLGGFVLQQLQRIRREGDHFLASGHRFEVADLDCHPVDKVLIQRWPSAARKQPR